MKNAPTTEQANPLLNRSDLAAAVGLGLASLAVYVRTLAPGLLPGDGGEFQTLAFTLDHAHTTGYEVYMVLAKLFTFLPVVDVAYRVNLFSAVMGALTVALVYLAGRVLSGSRWAAALGALVLALSATFWSQAVVAEVYTAGSAFTAAVLLFTLLWWRTECARYLVFAGVLGGLSIGVHGSGVLFAPAVIALIIIRTWSMKKNLRLLSRQVILPAAAGALIGLALMVGLFAMVDARETQASMLHAAYIPSATRWDVTPEYFDTFTGRFSFLVFAQQWRSVMFADPDRTIPENLGRFNRFFWNDFGLLGLLVLIAFVSLFRRSKPLLVFFIVGFAVYAWYTLNYGIWDIYVFFIAGFVYLAVLLAEGAKFAGGLVERWRADARSRADARPRPQVREQFFSAALIAMFLIFSAPTVIGYLSEGHARWDFFQYPSNIEMEARRLTIRGAMDDLPENAAVLIGWDLLYNYAYVAHVELGRTEMTFMEAYPYANKEGMAESLVAYLTKELYNGRPVFAAEEFGELTQYGMTLTPVNVGGQRWFEVNFR